MIGRDEGGGLNQGTLTAGQFDPEGPTEQATPAPLDPARQSPQRVAPLVAVPGNRQADGDATGQHGTNSENESKEPTH